AGVEEMIREADPVAEQSTTRERARRVDRDDAGGLAELTDVREQGADQRRLADTGRPGHADHVRAAGLGIEVADDVVGERVGVLDERDRARERSTVAFAHARRERLAGPVPASGHAGTLCSRNWLRLRRGLLAHSACK